jgi:DNA segregation ATPase FtsK/SpoIIIE, S-DNA-T family
MVVKMKFFEKMKARGKLFKSFRAGGIYLGEINKPIFPKVHSVKLDGTSIEYVFTLPTGLDPKIMDKNEYVFKQVFGDQIKIDGEFKTFTLTVYQKPLPKILKYNSQEILETINDHSLGIICGKDRNGQYMSYDLLKQPHLLIAGETGSGKSTQLRSILTTLILSKKPNELEIYLADCKKSEFHIFRNVEHVKCVLSNPREIKRMLKHIKKELDERSDLTEVFEVSHIDDLPKGHKRPYIVVCIDEFVMLRNDQEIMEILIEIVAIGRTLGVFAILSMQRPNGKVLDTTIRANLTVSMGFKLRDKLEARIVNTPGAEDLKMPGQFIMNSDDEYHLMAPFLSMDEAKKLLNPFMVSKQKEIKEPEPITEKDVFLDVKG